MKKAEIPACLLHPAEEPLGKGEQALPQVDGAVHVQHEHAHFPQFFQLLLCKRHSAHPFSLFFGAVIPQGFPAAGPGGEFPSARRAPCSGTSIPENPPSRNAPSHRQPGIARRPAQGPLGLLQVAAHPWPCSPPAGGQPPLGSAPVRRTAPCTGAAGGVSSCCKARRSTCRAACLRLWLAAVSPKGVPGDAAQLVQAQHIPGHLHRLLALGPAAQVLGGVDAVQVHLI